MHMEPLAGIPERIWTYHGTTSYLLKTNDFILLLEPVNGGNKPCFDMNAERGHDQKSTFDFILTVFRFHLHFQYGWTTRGTQLVDGMEPPLGKVSRDGTHYPPALVLLQRTMVILRAVNSTTVLDGISSILKLPSGKLARS